jgi:hypothetical protein
MRKLFVIGLMLLAGNIFAQSSKLTGHVTDSSGSIMRGAQLKVFRADQVVKEAVSADDGSFEIALDPGEYKIEVSAPDFEPYVKTVNVTPDLAPLTVSMNVAQLQQTVEVTAVANQVSIEPDASLKTTILEDQFVDTLPDETDDLVNYLQQVAGARGEAGADTIFVIDGFTSGRVPPKDQIQEVRINNNPFSAEYSGVGFTRTEIVSKAGTGSFHGTTNFLFRDDVLNARNPFALSRPPYQQRNFNTSFSGPVIANKFTLNLNLRDNENQLSDTVRAILPTGQISEPVVMPNTNRAGNIRGQWALNGNNSFTFNLDYQHIHNENQGIGGFTLAERAFTRHGQNTEYQIRETAVLSKQLVHEFRFSYRRDYSRTDPAVDGFEIDVLGAFNAGSAQNKNVNDNRAVEFGDLWMYSGGRWNFKAGGQLVRRLNHNTNYNNFSGTFTFSSLAAYLAGQPETFTLNKGNPFLDDTQIELGTFFQSDWKAARNLNLSLGARYETQTNITVNNLDPRLGFAYQVSKNTVVRGGIGAFHLRLAQFIVDQLLRFDGIHQEQFYVLNPSYPDPFVSCQASSTCEPASIRMRSPELRTPYNVISDLSLEQSLPKGLGLTFSWDFSRGIHLYRSRNINAPFPVGSYIRPNPLQGNLPQIESTASSRSHNFTFGLRQTWRNKWNLAAFGTYTYGWSYNDTDGPFSQPQNSYDMRGEWGRAPLDQRNRFVTGVSFRRFWNLIVNTNVQANSNIPFNVITGFDDNHDGTVNDRPPGVTRNSGKGPDYFNVNISFQKVVSLKSEVRRPGGSGPGGPNLAFIVNLWNALNHPQYQNYSGVLTSSYFGRPNRANNPRNIELAMRFNF